MSKLHVEELEARQLFSGNSFFTPSFGVASSLGEQRFGQAGRSRDEIRDASQIIQIGRDLWIDGSGQVRLHGMMGPDGTDLHVANVPARVVDAAFAGLEPTNLASLLPFGNAASPNAMRGDRPFSSEPFAETASTLTLGNPAGRSGSALREPARPGANVVAPSRLDESGEQPHEGGRPQPRELSSPVTSANLRALAAAIRGLVEGLEKISPRLDRTSDTIRWYVWIAAAAAALAAAELGRRLLKRSNASPALQLSNLPPGPPRRTRA